MTEIKHFLLPILTSQVRNSYNEVKFGLQKLEEGVLYSRCKPNPIVYLLDDQLVIKSTHTV